MDLFKKLLKGIKNAAIKVFGIKEKESVSKNHLNRLLNEFSSSLKAEDTEYVDIINSLKKKVSKMTNDEAKDYVDLSREWGVFESLYDDVQDDVYGYAEELEEYYSNHPDPFAEEKIAEAKYKMRKGVIKLIKNKGMKF